MKARRNSKLLAACVVTLPLLIAAGSQAASTSVGEQFAPLLMAAPVAQSPQLAATIVAKLSDAREKYGIDLDHSYRLMVQHPGEAGTRISRFAHTYKGVRVFQSESVVVTDGAGNIVSESVSDRRDGLGRGSAAIRLGSRYANFDVTPALTPQAAADVVVRDVAAIAVHTSAPKAELVIYPVVQRVRVPSAVYKREWQLNAVDLVEQVTGYELAYQVQARLVSNAGDRPLFRDAIVSANDGRILAQWDGLQTVVGVGNSQYNGQVPISTMQSGIVYMLRDPTRGVGGAFGANVVTNAKHGNTSGSVYGNLTNTWGDGQNYVSGGSTTNANGQTAAVNAMWGLMNTYDTLKKVLGWNSLDGNNTATHIAAHVYNNYDNAFYNDTCRCMFIGDGGLFFYSMGSIDIIGHEMGHGITAATSNLDYFGESGGLNESASDINGEMVEAYARAGGTGSLIPASGNDWMIGKEVGRSGSPLRWMYKPSKDRSSPDAWNSSLTSLDVHYSSGPNNRMFYFLAQGSSADSTSDFYSPYLTKSPRAMTGIGNDKAYRIWFRALTTKFTASTNYVGARNKVIEAAQEMYGVGSREAIAAQRAYAAINVGNDIDEGASGTLAISLQPQNVTVLPGALATFSAVASGGKPPYKFQWMRNLVDIRGATAPAYSLTAQSSDNGALFSVRVNDSALPPGSVTSRAGALAVSTSAPVERVINGSFEQGITGWTSTRALISDSVVSGSASYNGQFFAYLGGKGRQSSSMLEQAVSIPANTISAQLRFALHVSSSEYSRATPYDKLTVTVKNLAGTVLGTLATYSNINAAGGYQVQTFNLLPYKGQSVVLSFVATEDFSLQTSFSIDAVSVVTQ